MSWMISREMMVACASSPSSQALVAAYSADTCSDGAPSAQLSVMPTRRRFYVKDKMMGYSHRSLCGLTCPRLTVTRGRALLRSYLADFHARIFRRPERAQVSPAAAPASGKSLPGLLARFDRATSSWRTPQSSLLAGSMLFSATWPRSGSMRNGACYRRPMLARRTSGNGCGLWPTPSATDGQRGGTITPQMTGQSLPQMINTPEKWPTPTSRDYRSPNAKPYADRGGGKKGEQLPNFVGGQLNPDWVEWLMNWPIGWSSIGSLTTIRPHDWSIEPPDVPRVATGIPARVDRLKALGNGQVPQCAAEAWRLLHKRLTEDR